MNEKLVWNVYLQNNAGTRFEAFNIFRHVSFRESVWQTIVKYRNSEDKEKFAKEIKSDLMYYFWCKSEYELVLKQWVGRECEQKVDIFEQVYLNWDHFIDYLWRVTHQDKQP